ncbi:NAD kinase [Methylophaga lonarensis MPL]|uniref:NAD kinase n=1 Tax=Methylophaga lonarensis MPL TaxID=1286106 RepID=M7NUE0_9GAMM|nr:NAD(+) kinase [Methylophaga lonarensis]EMR12388.1 NAD kinase [Methylophaga lonarensis MPL]
MQTSFNRIGLFIRKDDPVMENAVVQVCKFLESQSVRLYTNEPLSFLPALQVLSVHDFPEHCDLTIAIGGDGTMLSASRALAGSNLPIVGINVGRLGFLADVTLPNLEQQLQLILSGHYRDDSRFLLEASINDVKGSAGIAMNDVVIHAHQRLQMIEFETYINGRFLNSQRADGLVIATPTGSTAYAMSAGGPILDVDLDAIVLTSVCPHTLSNRPLVIAASSQIDIMLSEHNTTTAMVTCDGRAGHLLQPGDTMRVVRHSDRIRLLHLENHDHYSILRAKLEWGRKLTC